MSQQKMQDVKEPSPAKVLNYIKKAELVSLVSPQRYSQIENEVKQQLGVERANLKQVKKYLSTNQDFINALKQNPLWEQGVKKYEASKARLTNPTLVARSRATRQAMRQPRSRYLGCLATKLQPEDFRDCYDAYNDAKYDNMKLVPSGLKKQIYNTTDDKQLQEVLRPSVMNPNTSFSDLPSGLRGYIRTHPSEFANYVQERKNELRLLRSVLRNMPLPEKQRLRAYFSQNKNIPFEQFTKIIRGQPIEESKKRVRGRGEPDFNIRRRGGHYYDDHGIEHYAPSERSWGNDNWDAESVFTDLTTF